MRLRKRFNQIYNRTGVKNGMISLQKANAENKSLLWDMLQRYLREMSEYYELETDENGCFRYKYFEAYFTEDDRMAYLIYFNRTPAGFALVNPYSYLDADTDHVLAEFCIMPEFRQKSIGIRAAQHILDLHPGRWQIKYSENNPAAKRLWNRLAAQYHSARHSAGEDETILSFTT